MKARAPIHELVEKKVSRSEFIKIAGFGLLTVVGLSSIIQLLAGKKNPLTQSLKQPSGYSAGYYNR